MLIDFWAHYCQPCIKEIPHLAEAYQKYKSKKFKIINISVDKEEHYNRWIDVVNKYTSAWDNGIDNFNKAESAFMAYRGSGIPANFLIDPKGKIIAVDLKGDNLKNTLDKLLN